MTSARVLAAMLALTVGVTVASAARSARPAAASAAPAARFEVFANANDVEAIVVHAGRLYAATGGGVAVWDLATGRLVRTWTSADGLLGTHARAIALCAMPRPTVVVGSLDGLSLLDPATGAWRTMTPTTSSMAAAAVTSLAADGGRLCVGYAYAGVDLFDSRTGAWRHVATVNGLLANHVESVALGHDGGAWAGTSNGLSHVGARDVTTYTTRDLGFTGALAGAIALDAKGNPWAVTSLGRLVRGTNGGWTTYGAEALRGLVPRARAGVATSADGAVWFEATSGDLVRWDPAAGRTTLVGRPPLGGETRGLWVAPDGTLFVARSTGVAARAPSGAWRTFVAGNDAMSSNQIRALALARDGAVWVATGAGVYRADAASRRLTPVEVPAGEPRRADVLTLFPDPAGAMWAGTAGGVGRLGRAHDPWIDTRRGLVNDTVRAIARDAHGRMWFGTVGGITVWDGARARNWTARDGLPSERIHALLAHGPVMFVGTDNSLVRIEDERIVKLDDDALGIEFESMERLEPWRRDSLIVGTSNGLGYIDGRTGREDPEVYGDAVRALAVGPNDELWVGTNLTGLYHRAGAGWQTMTVADGLPSNQITALLVDRAGAVWIGTADAGLARYLPPRRAAPARATRSR